MLARLIDALQVNFTQDDLLAVVNGLGNDHAEGIAQER